MGSLEDDAESRYLKYAELNDFVSVGPGKPLGIGEDGIAWETPYQTVVKVFYRERNFQREIDCYERLAEREITEIAGFEVPDLIKSDYELLAIEMGLVTPPRIIDFGKAYVDQPGPFSGEMIQEHLEDKSRDYSEEDWGKVMDAYYELISIGIYYYDLRPANVQVREDELP